MLGFVIPIKNKDVSRDWTYDTTLLERTLRSICGQTDPGFRVFIVHAERPNITFSHPSIVYTPYPFPIAPVDTFEDMDYALKYHSRDYAEKMMDKGKKITFGCQQAISAGCDYVMAVDSDDLVSNRLASYVNRRSADREAGWRIHKGYVYVENSRILVKKYDIQNVNGSTHILRSDLIGVPDFSRNIFWNFNLFESHGYTYSRIRHFHGQLLRDYPAFGIVYVVHKNNHSNISRLVSAITLKNIAKKIARGRVLTARIKMEYGLYPLRA